ncbi:MAG: sulfatase [Candidatus Micrarchaeota archaeon]|nr:sulfatase [Candidatus Micrarchaeota archaeon]
MMPNILLIVCDTMNRDALRVYGGEAKTPNLEKLAKDSMVYDNCIAPSPWTFPSHVSLFTGMYPSEHGVHETNDEKTEELAVKHMNLDAKRLPEYLQSEGYNTIGISNNLMISRFTGFDKGFNLFFNLEPSPWGKSKLGTEGKRLGSDIKQVGAELIRRGRSDEIPKFAKEFLRIKRMARAFNYPMDKGASLANNLIADMALRNKFFLFVNYYEVHEPYVSFDDKENQDNFTGIKPYSDGRVRELKADYVSEAEYLDGHIGALIEMLKMRGLYEDTMIIFTSDHGQAFNEHGFMYHGIYLYDEIVRVPLIVKYPHNRKFKKRNGYQSLVNIPDFVRDVIHGSDDRNLTSEVVFSEAYGNIDRPPEAYKSRMGYVNAKYEKSRKAVYAKDMKLTVNGSEGTIEELMDGKKDLDYRHYKDKKKLAALMNLIGSQSAREKFKMPKHSL